MEGDACVAPTKILGCGTVLALQRRSRLLKCGVPEGQATGGLSRHRPTQQAIRLARSGGLQGCLLQRRRAGIRCPDWPVRVRQVHPSAHCRRAVTGKLRRRAVQGQGGSRAAARHDVYISTVQQIDLSLEIGDRQRLSRREIPLEAAAPRDRKARPRAAQARRSRSLRRLPSLPALRRHAAARGHSARSGRKCC